MLMPCQGITTLQQNIYDNELITEHITAQPIINNPIQQHLPTQIINMPNQQLLPITQPITYTQQHE